MELSLKDRETPAAGLEVLASKILANLCFLLLPEVFLLPIFAALYNLNLPPILPQLLLVLLLGTLALAIVGTVFSAISSHARMRELLLPLLLLPLLAPALIAGTEATRP